MDGFKRRIGLSGSELEAIHNVHSYDEEDPEFSTIFYWWIYVTSGAGGTYSQLQILKLAMRSWFSLAKACYLKSALDVLGPRER